MPTSKTYRPKKKHEGMRLSQMLADRDRPFVVEARQWPYTTSDVGEQTVLDAHPWITDRAKPDSGNADDGNADDGADEASASAETTTEGS